MTHKDQDKDLNLVLKESLTTRTRNNITVSGSTCTAHSAMTNYTIIMLTVRRIFYRNTRTHICCSLSLSLSLSLSILTAIFQVNLEQMNDYCEAKNDGSGGNNWSYKSCKAPVKSSPPTNQHPVCLVRRCKKLLHCM